jgi:hypothetical protein
LGGGVGPRKGVGQTFYMVHKLSPIVWNHNV